MDHVEEETRKAIEKAMDKMVEGMPPSVKMVDRVPDGGYVSRNGLLMVATSAATARRKSRVARSRSSVSGASRERRTP
jgi:hypothetical protein